MTLDSSGLQANSANSANYAPIPPIPIDSTFRLILMKVYRSRGDKESPGKLLTRC